MKNLVNKILEIIILISLFFLLYLFFSSKIDKVQDNLKQMDSTYYKSLELLKRHRDTIFLERNKIQQLKNETQNQYNSYYNIINNTADTNQSQITRELIRLHKTEDTSRY